MSSFLQRERVAFLRRKCFEKEKMTFPFVTLRVEMVGFFEKYFQSVTKLFRQCVVPEANVYNLLTKRKEIRHFSTLWGGLVDKTIDKVFLICYNILPKVCHRLSIFIYYIASVGSQRQKKFKLV